ncbi:MAG: hypothetical protein Q7R47_04040, partial [Candidatus Diapherotrites archaeon]|nr:hypothetical protein [Candidatus Diapherotrites archaeon]
IGDMIIDHVTGWVLKAEQEAIQRFRNNATAAAPAARPPRTSTQGYQKPGTRMQRIAAHANGTDPEKTPSERTQDLQTRQDMARTAGVPFSQTRYIFEQITRQNPAAAQFLSQRLARRDISSDTVTRLFTAGPLTIRVFQHALDQAGFEQAFGRTEIETLARGLANIGGFGKKNERAKAGFRSSRGTEIFEFLVRNGLLETRHHKGQAVYLKRI